MGGVLKPRVWSCVLALSAGAGLLASTGSACTAFRGEAKEEGGEDAGQADGGYGGEAATPDAAIDADPCKTFVAPGEQTGLVDCGGPEPVNLNDARAHCGACGHSCGVATCIGGVCNPAAWEVRFSDAFVVRVVGARGGTPIALGSHRTGSDAGAVFALASDGGTSSVARLDVAEFPGGALDGDDLYAFSTTAGVVQVNLAPDASAPSRRSLFSTDRARAAITKTELILATGRELRSIPRFAGSDAGTRTLLTSAAEDNIVSVATASVEGAPIFYVAKDGAATQTQTLYRFTTTSGSKAVLTASGLADLAVDAQYLYFFNAVEKTIRRIALSTLTSIGAGFVAEVGLVVQAGDPLVADAGYNATERRRFEVRGDHVYFFAVRPDNMADLKRVHRCGGPSFPLAGPIDPVSLSVPEGDYAFYSRRDGNSESIVHRVPR